MNKYRRYKLLRISIFLLILLAGFAGTFHLALAFLIAVVISFLLVVISTFESELVDNGEIKLEQNGGTKSGNIAAKILLALLVLVILVPVIIKIITDI